MKILFKLLEYILDIFILAPHPTTIGNTAEEIFFGIIAARKNGKKLLLIKPYQLPIISLPIANKYLLEIDSKFLLKNQIIKTIANIALTVNFTLFRIITRYINLNEKYTEPKYGRENIWKINNQKEIDTKSYWKDIYTIDNDIVLNLNLIKKGDELIKKLGINDNKWFVCLHVRDSGFWKDKGLDEYRNANIQNYYKVIEKIHELGGITIRMGDKSMVKLPKLRGLIDYPFSNEKSELLDLYLIKKCKLYIGMQSGILDVAILFSKPIIITNMVSWMFQFPPKKGDLGILKHLYDNKGNKISVEERLKLGWEAGGHKINTEKYKLEENSSDEILEVVEQFFENKQTNISLNNKFEKMRRIKFKEIIENESKINRVEKLRLISRLYSVSGSLGNAYLKNNL
jgi:putative glycosyltransferase (TIGR04372 family)